MSYFFSNSQSYINYYRKAQAKIIEGHIPTQMLHNTKIKAKYEIDEDWSNQAFRQTGYVRYSTEMNTKITEREVIKISSAS